MPRSSIRQALKQMNESNTKLVRYSHKKGLYAMLRYLKDVFQYQLTSSNGTDLYFTDKDKAIDHYVKEVGKVWSK